MAHGYEDCTSKPSRSTLLCFLIKEEPQTRGFVLELEEFMTQM